jgi:hypothetical protein
MARETGLWFAPETHGKHEEGIGKERDVTKRIAIGTVTAVLMVLSAAGSAAADPGNTPPGPGGCFGPPGRTGLVYVAKSILDVPPGQLVSYCNDNGHGQSQGNGAVAG